MPLCAVPTASSDASDSPGHRRWPWTSAVLLASLLAGYLPVAVGDWFGEWTALVCGLLLVPVIVVSHLRVHPWLLLPAIWALFMLALAVALFIHALDPFLVLALIFLAVYSAAYVTVVNVVVLAVRRKRERARSNA